MYENCRYKIACCDSREYELSVPIIIMIKKKTKGLATNKFKVKENCHPKTI